MTYYLHRISHYAELSYPLLKRGILSIGFSELATHEFIRDHQATNWQDVPSAIEKEWGKYRPRFSLQRFLQMNKGDRVVVPSWGTFHVYDIASNDRMIAADLDLHNLETWEHHGVHMDKGRLCSSENGKNGKTIDLGFFHKVKEVETDIPRSDYADNALTARMKVRQTNVEISDLRDSIEDAILRWQNKKPINIAKSITDDCAGKVLDKINKQLSPSQLEKLLKWYFERIGASSVEIPSKNARDKDGDADIVATFEPIRTIVYVQAKHHEGTTDDWALDQIDRYVKNREELGEDDGYTKIPWVISSGTGFSKCCHEKAEQCNVYLIAGKELAARILKAGITDMELS